MGRGGLFLDMPRVHLEEIKRGMPKKGLRFNWLTYVLDNPAIDSLVTALCQHRLLKRILGDEKEQDYLGLGNVVFNFNNCLEEIKNVHSMLLLRLVQDTIQKKMGDHAARIYGLLVTENFLEEQKAG